MQNYYFSTKLHRYVSMTKAFSWVNLETKHIKKAAQLLGIGRTYAGVLKMRRKEQFSNITLRAVNHLIAFSFGLSLTGLLIAQDTVEWTTLGNDFAHTRSTPATQITPQNFPLI